MTSNPPSEQIEVRRSRRRTRTVSAFREGSTIVVAIPARFTATQEREWVEKMVEHMARQERKRRPSDGQLARRAKELSQRYLSGRATPTSVAWVTNQDRRWGSCTPSDGTIRISHRLKGMPIWVIDYVILHELAHLLHHGHGPKFWAILEAYPRTERARGFLEGVDYEQFGGSEARDDDEHESESELSDCDGQADDYDAG